MKSFWVYILCSNRNGTLYVGVTNNLMRRSYEHKEKMSLGFTKRYDVTKLVHVEEFATMPEGIFREKCLKKWRREWKIELIEKHNPEWMDLYDVLL